MDNCYISLPIEDEEQLKELVEKGKDWALVHGIGMRSKEHFSRETVTFAPFILFPSKFPREEFQKAKKLQRTLNELMHKVAYDDQFLRQALLETIDADPFMARLVQIYQEVLTEGVAQKWSLGLFRSDYLMDTQSGTIKQVEFNTIAASFGALTSILPNWHKYAVTSQGHEFEHSVNNIPASQTLPGFADALLAAYALYNAKKPSNKSAILFVVEDMSFNVADQRHIEFEIQAKNPHVRVLRRTLTEIGTHFHLGAQRRLFLGDIEIAVVYYRSGYVPGFYHSELEWQARVHIERSKAIKCPSVQYQLAGSKKIQQELARPGVLEKFISDSDQLKAVREVFTGLYSLDVNDPKSEGIIDLAIVNPSKFVLKPQREGGGNNLYDNDIAIHLNKIRHTLDRHGWILMDKINAPVQKNYLVRPGHEEALYTDVVSELGVFGVIIGNADTIHLNEEVGHMLRSKENTSNEGGVVMGAGALDSLYLT